MTESDNFFESFPRYFTVRPAVTLKDRQETYRIRYRVYCEEFGYEPAERFPGQMETDDYDDISTHSLITHIATGAAAGCVRICPASIHEMNRPLPYERCCTHSLDQAAMANFAVPRERICEASRFAVDAAFRRRSGEAATRFGAVASPTLSDAELRTFPLISMVLLLACTAVSELLERPYMFAVMEPFLPRLLKRTGIAFHRLGRDVNHHGIRAVYVAETQDFIRRVEADFRDLYLWVRGELGPGLSTLPANEAQTDSGVDKH